MMLKWWDHIGVRASYASPLRILGPLDRLENNGVRGTPSVSIRKAVAETFNGKFTLNFMMEREAFGQCKALCTDNFNN